MFDNWCIYIYRYIYIYIYIIIYIYIPIVNDQHNDECGKHNAVNLSHGGRLYTTTRTNCDFGVVYYWVYHI